jgi:hypothetical protein
MRKSIACLSLLGLLAGCAISRKVEYETVSANVPAFKEHISIATWDQREQILNGARKTDFVGYMRSSAGIAYPMGTSSEKPFADVVSSSVAASFTKKGNKTSVVATSYSDKENLILEKLRKTKADKLLLIKCYKFYTDGYGATALLFDLQLNIFSPGGDLLKQKTFSGKRELGGSKAWGAGKFKEYIPEGYKKLLEEIFNDPEIVAALQK